MINLYGTGEIDVLLDHFDVKRDGESFIDVAKARLEWQSFKCGDLIRCV